MGGRGQQGISLLLALIFVALLGSVLATLTRYTATEVRRNEAAVAGWELVEIGKAARLYVRDQNISRSAAGGDLRVDLAGGAQIITVDQLKAGGYLPAGFGRKNAAGQDINALRQRIYIALANWSPNGVLGPATGPVTVPASFVGFAENARSSPSLINDVVSAARGHGAALTAPLFDVAGNNVSADCRGAGPAVSLWDTGCMTLADLAFIGASIGTTQFKAGGLIIPAWKTVQPDLRAVMRYPQPDNPGFATMLTHIEMGTPVAGCKKADGTHDTTKEVQAVTVDAAGNATNQPTGVCDVDSDTGIQDKRFNIENAANVSAQRLIGGAQAVDFNGGDFAYMGAASTDEVLRVDGTAKLSNDLRVYNTMPRDPSLGERLQVAGTLAIDRNTYVYSQNAASKGVANVSNTAAGRQLVSDNLSSDIFNSTQPSTIYGTASQLNVSSRTNNSGSTTVTGSATAELSTETLNGPNAQLHAYNNGEGSAGRAQITGTMDMGTSQIDVAGNAAPNGYSAIIGEINGATDAQPSSSTIIVNGNGAPDPNTPDLRFLAANGSLSTGSTGGVSGYAPAGSTPTIGTTGTCKEGRNIANACPDRQYFPPNITP